MTAKPKLYETSLELRWDGDRPPIQAVFRHGMKEGLREAEPDLQGTSFFVHPLGLFVTAVHVIETWHPTERQFTLVRFEGMTCEVLPVRQLHCYPNLDVAIGWVKPQARVLPLALDASEIREDDLVYALGFPETKWDAVPREGTPLPDLVVDYRPRVSPGRVNDAEPDGKPGCFRHNAWAPNGMSGGPVFLADPRRPASKGVCGVTHWGMSVMDGDEPCETAVKVSTFIDLPVPFLEGMSLREATLATTLADNIGPTFQVRE